MCRTITPYHYAAVLVFALLRLHVPRLLSLAIAGPSMFVFSAGNATHPPYARKAGGEAVAIRFACARFFFACSMSLCAAPAAHHIKLSFHPRHFAFVGCAAPRSLHYIKLPQHNNAQRIRTQRT